MSQHHARPEAAKIMNGELVTVSIGDSVPPHLAALYGCPTVIGLACDLAAHYGVSACLISLEDGNGEISTVAQYSTEPGDEPKKICVAGLLNGSRLCTMLVKRGAPVIIGNTRLSHLSDDKCVGLSAEDARAVGAPMNGIVFFVEQSLKFPSGRWRGTICLADGISRLFGLEDCEHLKAVSNELVQILTDLGMDEL